MTGLVLTIATWGNVPATMLGAGLIVRFGAFRIFLLSTGALVIGMLGAALLDLPVTFALLIGIVGSFSSRRDHRNRHPISATREPAVGMGLFYSMSMPAVPWCLHSAVEQLTCPETPTAPFSLLRPCQHWHCQCTCCTEG